MKHEIVVDPCGMHPWGLILGFMTGSRMDLNACVRLGDGCLEGAHP